VPLHLLIPVGLLLASCSSPSEYPPGLAGAGGSSSAQLPPTAGSAAEPPGPPSGGAPANGDSGSTPGPSMPPGDGGSLVQRRSARVLFSGHSLLDNPMPDWVQSIAQSRGDIIEWEQQIVIGSPIRVRTRGDDASASGFAGYGLGKNKNGNGKDLLAELANPSELTAGERYDTLLITERNDLLLSVQYENTIGYLRDFHDRLVAHNAQGGSLLYQVWPEIDKANPQPWVDYVRQELYAWECVAHSVNTALQGLGRSDRVGVIPGGVALASLVERLLSGTVPGITGTPSEQLDLVLEDDVHLQPAGTYLLAALHYAALFGRSPVGAAAPAAVPAAAVPALQQLAWDVLSDYRATATPWAHSLDDCRQRVATQICPAYFTLVGRSGDATSCADWSGSDGPLGP
jgi:hypothetical protein